MAALSAAMPILAPADDDMDETTRTENVLSLLRMREKAGEFSVSRPATRDNRPTLCAKPLLRYSDPANGYRDATVWVWETDGFPIAVAKVEDFDSKNRWQYCIASLAPDALVVTRPGQPLWQSKGPGITFQRIAGLADAENQARRLLVMKSLARRFEGEFQSGGTGDRQQMRPLPRPLHRFSSAELGVIDGGIFSFAVSGTNPTVLLVIVLREDDANTKSHHWEYAVAGMTSDAASISIDDRVVWSKEANYTKKYYDTWYFHQQAKLSAR